MSTSVEIAVVLDRSGSMTPIAGDMRGAFDQLIKDQRKEKGECHVSLYQFDNHYEVVYEHKNVDDVPKLELVPRGYTALYDAVGKTITSLGERLAALPKRKRPDKVIFVIITDGHENASAEWTHKAVTDAIKHQQDKYSWEFVFLGSTLDTAAVAHGLGIRAFALFDNTKLGARKTGASLSSSISGTRSHGTFTYDQNTYNAAVP